MNPHVLVLLTDAVSSVFVRGQLRHVMESGFSVSVGVNHVDSTTSSLFDDCVDLYPLGFVRQPSPLRDAWSFVRTIALIRRIRPAVVHASTPKAGLIGMFAAWLCRVPVRVYQVRGFRHETMTGVSRHLFRLLERCTMFCATDRLFNSASLLEVAEREGLVPLGSGIVSGSGNGVDCERFTPATPSERRASREQFGLPSDWIVVGYVGRLTHDKGIDDLLQAFDAVGRDDVRLLIVGAFENGDPVSDATRDRIMSDPRIVVHEWVNDTRSVYTAIDVLMFPSYREGLPNVPLEAQACGVPVVGYAATGTVDAVIDGETGILVPVGDRSALAAALTSVLDDEGLRSRMGTNGRSHMESAFRPQDVWERIVNVYRSGLDR